MSVAATRQTGLRRWLLAVLGAALMGLAWLGGSYLRPTTLPCAQARTLVTSRHGAVFGSMRDAAGPVSLGCVGDPTGNGDLVTIIWNQGAVARQATYAVGLDGAVRPMDANAAALERLARRLSHGGPLPADAFGAPTFR